MSVAVIYHCTIYNESKKATNHWFAALQTENVLSFYKWEDARTLGILQDDATLHLCGEKHCQELLGRFLHPQPNKETPNV